MSLKPIFHWKWGLRWLPNANEIYTKKMKCTWPLKKFAFWTQRHLYSTDWRRGLASEVTQITPDARVCIGSKIQTMQNSGVGGTAQRQPRCQVLCVAVEYRLKAPCRMSNLRNSAVALSISPNVACRFKKNGCVGVLILGF